MAPNQMGSGSKFAGPNAPPEVDLSHLTEEERLMIQSVMVKAEMAEMGVPVDTSGPSSTNLPSNTSIALTQQRDFTVQQQKQQQQQQIQRHNNLSAESNLSGVESMQPQQNHITSSQNQSNFNNATGKVVISGNMSQPLQVDVASTPIRQNPQQLELNSNISINSNTYAPRVEQYGIQIKSEQIAPNQLVMGQQLTTPIEHHPTRQTDSANIHNSNNTNQQYKQMDHVTNSFAPNNQQLQFQSAHGGSNTMNNNHLHNTPTQDYSHQTRQIIHNQNNDSSSNYLDQTLHQQAKQQALQNHMLINNDLICRNEPNLNTNQANMATNEQLQHESIQSDTFVTNNLIQQQQTQIGQAPTQDAMEERNYQQQHSSAQSGQQANALTNIEYQSQTVNPETISRTPPPPPRAGAAATRATHEAQTLPMSRQLFNEQPYAGSMRDNEARFAAHSNERQILRRNDNFEQQHLNNRNRNQIVRSVSPQPIKRQLPKPTLTTSIQQRHLPIKLKQPVSRSEQRQISESARSKSSFSTANQDIPRAQQSRHSQRGVRPENCDYLSGDEEQADYENSYNERDSIDDMESGPRFSKKDTKLNETNKLLTDLKLAEQANHVMEQQQRLIKQNQELIKLQMEQAALSQELKNSIKQQKQDVLAKGAKNSSGDDTESSVAAKKASSCKKKVDKSDDIESDDLGDARAKKQSARTAAKDDSIDKVDSKSTCLRARKDKTQGQNNNFANGQSSTRQIYEEKILSRIDNSPSDTTDESELDASSHGSTVELRKNRAKPQDKQLKPQVISRPDQSQLSGRASSSSSITTTTNNNNNNNTARATSSAPRRRREPTGLPPSPLPVAAAIQLHQIQTRQHLSSYKLPQRNTVNSLRSRSVTSSPQHNSCLLTSYDNYLTSGYATDNNISIRHNNTLNVMKQMSSLSSRANSPTDTQSEYGGGIRKRLPKTPANVVPVTPSMMRKITLAKQLGGSLPKLFQQQYQSTGNGPLSSLTSSSQLQHNSSFARSQLQNRTPPTRSSLDFNSFTLEKSITPHLDSLLLKESMMINIKPTLSPTLDTQNADLDLRVSSLMTGPVKPTDLDNHFSRIDSAKVNPLGRQSHKSTSPPSFNMFDKIGLGAHINRTNLMGEKWRRNSSKSYDEYHFDKHSSNYNNDNNEQHNKLADDTKPRAVVLRNCPLIGDITQSLAANKQESLSKNNTSPFSKSSGDTTTQTMMMTMGLNNGSSKSHADNNNNEKGTGIVFDESFHLESPFLLERPSAPAPTQAPSDQNFINVQRAQSELAPLFNNNQNNNNSLTRNYRDLSMQNATANSAASFNRQTSLSSSNINNNNIYNDRFSLASNSNAKSAASVLDGLLPASSRPAYLAELPFMFEHLNSLKPRPLDVSNLHNYHASNSPFDGTQMQFNRQQAATRMIDANKNDFFAAPSGFSLHNNDLSTTMQPNAQQQQPFQFGLMGRHSSLEHKPRGSMINGLSRLHERSVSNPMTNGILHQPQMTPSLESRSNFIHNDTFYPMEDFNQQYAYQQQNIAHNEHMRAQSYSKSLNENGRLSWSESDYYGQQMACDGIMNYNNNNNNNADVTNRPYDLMSRRATYDAASMKTNPISNQHQQQQQLQQINSVASANIQSLTKDDILSSAPKFSSIGYRFKTSSQNKYVPQARSLNDTYLSRYPNPYKRILLSKNPKDRIGNGIGISIIGGIPMQNLYDSINKSIVTSGAFVNEVFQSSNVHFMGDMHKGDQIIEWNGVNLCNRSNEEVQQILLSQFSDDEVEIIYLPQTKAMEAYGNNSYSTSDDGQRYNNMDNNMNLDSQLGSVKNLGSVESNNSDEHRQLMMQTQALINDFTKTSASNQNHRRKKSFSSSIANIWQSPKDYFK